MDTAKLMYRILSGLEERLADDTSERLRFIDLMCEKYGEHAVLAVLSMLVKKGLIEGVTVKQYLHKTGESVRPIAPVITVDGVEYLVMSPLMQKLAQ